MQIINFLSFCSTGILLVLKTCVGGSADSVSSESTEDLSKPLTSTTTQTDNSPSSLQQTTNDNNQQTSISIQLSSFFIGVAVGAIIGATAVGMCQHTAFTQELLCLEIYIAQYRTSQSLWNLSFQDGFIKAFETVVQIFSKAC